MDVNPRALRYFIAAAECGCISEAAVRLHVSQPSVSAAIMRLEASLEVQLFVRQPSRGVRLTAQGAEVLREARALMGHIDTFRASTVAVSERLAGELSLACFLNLGSNYLSEIIRTFAERHPHIDVHVHELDQQAIFNALADGRVEMALTFDLDLPAALESRTVATRSPFAVLATDDPLAGRSDVTLEELAARPFVLMDLPHTNDYFLSLFTDRGLVPAVRYRTRSFETVRTFVASGLGVSMQNLRPCSASTYNGLDIVSRPLAGDPKALNIVLLHYRRLKPRRIAKAFAEHVAEFFVDRGDAAAETALGPRATRR